MEFFHTIFGWASDAATSTAVRTFVALLAVPGALWGIYLFVLWLRGRSQSAQLEAIGVEVTVLRDRVVSLHDAISKPVEGLRDLAVPSAPYSPTESALATVLVTAYVQQALKGIRPDHLSLGTDPAVARELTKVNREKNKANDYVINLPVACPLINPLCYRLFDLLLKENLRKCLPSDESIPWDYEPRFVWDIYREEAISKVAADPYPHIEYSDDPQTKRIQQAFVASNQVLRDVCDALIVTALSTLQARFTDRLLNFNSNSHVAEAASALSRDARMRTVVLNLTVLALSGGSATKNLPIWIPKDHSVARIIRRLLSTELSNMLPINLHSISVPGFNMEAMLPPTLFHGFAFPIDYLEEMLAKRPHEEQLVALFE